MEGKEKITSLVAILRYFGDTKELRAELQKLDGKSRRELGALCAAEFGMETLE